MLPCSCTSNASAALGTKSCSGTKVRSIQVHGPAPCHGVRCCDQMTHRSFLRRTAHHTQCAQTQPRGPAIQVEDAQSRAFKVPEVSLQYFSISKTVRMVDELRSAENLPGGSGCRCQSGMSFLGIQVAASTGSVWQQNQYFGNVAQR